jgi:ATP-dependent Clp protease protease subunit
MRALTEGVWVCQVMLTGRIDENTANSVVGQLLYLQTVSPTEPITLVINSGGGTVTAGLAIYDVMQTITVRNLRRRPER